LRQFYFESAFRFFDVSSIAAKIGETLSGTIFFGAFFTDLVGATLFGIAGRISLIQFTVSTVPSVIPIRQSTHRSKRRAPDGSRVPSHSMIDRANDT